MKICVRRVCVYAFILGFYVFAQSTASFAKDGKEGKSVDAPEATNTNPVRPSDFQWNAGRKLTWDDFRGVVNTVSDESAAATHCGIGFKTSTAGGKPEIIVYNTFYINKSWVKPDAKIASILDHEQGHFDLCEIYTRKLRERLNSFDFNAADVRQQLMSIYSEVNAEYERRQQAYEYETVHGTNFAQQKKWQDAISHELM